MPQFSPSGFFDLGTSEDAGAGVDLDDEVLLEQPDQGVHVELTGWAVGGYIRREQVAHVTRASGDHADEGAEGWKGWESANKAIGIHVDRRAELNQI